MSALICLICLFSISYGQGLQLGNDYSILNKDSERALDTYNNNNEINNPLREGIYKVIDADSTNTVSDLELKGLVNPGMISDHNVALNKTMNIIKNIINYALGLISLIALVYLMYHGILMVTAAGEEAQFKKGQQGLKTALIAIAGIGLSWIIVSFIFWIIAYIAK